MSDESPPRVPHPTAERPLLGLTVLVVEDSRFASEAVRLLCQRSGARLRRADTLAAAHRHLGVYQPNVLIADMGLPDGSGAELIAELARARPRVPVLLGMSGDPEAEALALAAGADGFLAKPVESLALFQQSVLAHLPEALMPAGPRIVPNDMIAPDPLALTDDLAQVAELMRAPAAPLIDYLAQFLAGLGRSAHDRDLAHAAEDLAAARAAGLAPDLSRVMGLVEARLAAARPV